MSAALAPTRTATAAEQGRLVPCSEITLGMPVQVLVCGRPFEAIVIELAPRHARVEYLIRVGAHRERWLLKADVYPPGALQAFRAAVARQAPETDR